MKPEFKEWMLEFPELAGAWNEMPVVLKTVFERWIENYADECIVKYKVEELVGFGDFLIKNSMIAHIIGFEGMAKRYILQNEKDKQKKANL